MPTYDYKCQECGERFEYFQSMSSPSLRTRPDCEQKSCNVKRIISGGTGLIFKGSGFYLTDYKNKKSDNKKSKSDNPEAKTKKKKNSSAKGAKIS